MRLSVKAIVGFVLTLALCSVLIGVTVINRMRVERLNMEQIISDKGAQTYEVISSLLYKTQALSALVVQSNGEVRDFARVAATIVDDPSILNILIAPGGVVSDVYPIEGNEAVLGFDFFAAGEAGNREAQMAKELRQLVFGGPFDVRQGGQALVGRLPVYVGEEFWGLVSVTLRYPDALEGAGLDELQAQGLAYEIWRVNPDDGQRQVIAQSGYEYTESTKYVEKSVKILNAEWFFRILPVRQWYEYPETWVIVFFGFCVSLMVAFVLQSNSEQRRLKDQYEELARTDVLTGLYNRRHFMEMAPLQLERARRLNSGAYVAVLDVDKYKSINDTFGHSVGDVALATVATRIRECIRPYDLLARYGGDEFILLITDVREEDAVNIVERIRQSIALTPVIAGTQQVAVRASIGVAPVGSDLETAIKRADAALYRAKEEGRNRVVFVDV